MADNSFYSTSANTPNANQLAYNDYQLNHRLHELATMAGRQAGGQQEATPVPPNQVETLQAEVRKLEETRTHLLLKLAEIGREKSQISSTLGTALVACFGILAFYADPSSWEEDWFAGRRLGDSAAAADRGARARTIMKNLKETE